MVRMKLTDDDFDPRELDVPYDGSGFERYTGDIPKTGTILRVRVTKMWWTSAEDGTSMTKLIAVAENNNGSLAEFNGLPTWEYLTWKPSANFRYQPFLECFDISLVDIKKRMQVEANDDNIGTPIISIGDWEVGSDDAVAKIVIKKDFYREAQEWRSKVDLDGWIPIEDGDEEPEEDERPTRGRGRTTQASARGAKAASARTTTRHRAEPEDEDEDDEYDDDVEDEDDEEAEEDEAEAETEEEAPAPRGRTTSRRGARVAETRPARTAATRSGTSRTRATSSSRSGGSSSRANAAAERDRKGRGSQDEPPF